MLTQGWGGQQDLTVLARTLLTRLGYKPEHRTVTLTSSGEEALKKLSGVDAVPKSLVGISYTDAKGIQKIFVPVLNADLSELPGLDYLATDVNAAYIHPVMGPITIELFGKVIRETGNMMQQNQDLLGSLGAAIKGGEYENEYFVSVPV